MYREQEELLDRDNPWLEWLRVQMVAWQPNTCTFALYIEPRHLNRQRSLHGGLIATMLDAACGYSGAYSEPGEPKRHAVTVMLNTSYIRSEEHTSELQSLMRISYAVFCLKKKKNNTIQQ